MAAFGNTLLLFGSLLFGLAVVLALVAEHVGLRDPREGTTDRPHLTKHT